MARTTQSSLRAHHGTCGSPLSILQVLRGAAPCAVHGLSCGMSASEGAMRRFVWAVAPRAHHSYLPETPAPSRRPDGPSAAACPSSSSPRSSRAHAEHPCAIGGSSRDRPSATPCPRAEPPTTRPLPRALCFPSGESRRACWRGPRGARSEAECRRPLDDRHGVLWALAAH